MSEKLYKIGDAVPQSGRYVCTICELIVEYSADHIKNGVKFAECTLCHAGTEEGPKKPHEDFWKLVV